MKITLSKLFTHGSSYFFGEPPNSYSRLSLFQKVNFWIHNFPGITVRLGTVRIDFLDWFLGHPWDRFYINSEHWYITFSLFSGNQEWTGEEGWTRRWSHLSITPQNFREIDDAMNKIGKRDFDQWKREHDSTNS